MLISHPTALSRRAFLRKTGFALGVVHGVPRLIRAAAPDVEVSDLRVISRQPEFYHGWPTLTRRRNGQLMVVYSGGRESHVCPFGRVESMLSNDDGGSWTWPRVLFDGPIDDRDAGVVETSRGSLLVTTFSSLAYEDVSKGRNDPAWQAVNERLSAEERKAQLNQWMLRSEDGGVSWSTPYPSLVNSPHGPIELSDGQLLYPGKELWTGDRRVGVARSSDDGRSWQWLARIPVRAGDSEAEYHELHGVQAAGGRVIVHIRNHNPSNRGETLQTESTDGGMTWSTPHAIGVWGLPSFLMRLRDDRLLMTYGYRRKPFGNRARISADEGRTWSSEMVVSSDGVSGDLGYPSTVELKDGSLLSVWYERVSGNANAVLRQVRWRIRA
jgi:sialidase-1